MNWRTTIIKFVRTRRISKIPLLSAAKMKKNIVHSKVRVSKLTSILKILSNFMFILSHIPLYACAVQCRACRLWIFPARQFPKNLFSCACALQTAVHVGFGFFLHGCRACRHRVEPKMYPQMSLKMYTTNVYKKSHKYPQNVYHNYPQNAL